MEKLTPEQKKAADEIVSGPRGRVVGPFNVLLRSPDFMSRLQKTGEYLRFKSAHEPRLSELAILITARHWSQNFEWHHHRPIAEKAGLKADIIDAIAEGRRPATMAKDEAVIYDLLTELNANKTVSSPTYARALGQFGERGIVDLVGIAGYYSLLAMLMNTAATPLPEGTPPPLPTLP
ncbi:MAG TPA: carboxymuconolactone decarboxylase family protein [Hyphomicrobiaceae bacterium]|nr:carboxymuconolactone decarboxylase family protein [Hyphomicrobiaceae bacterium]